MVVGFCVCVGGGRGLGPGCRVGSPSSFVVEMVATFLGRVGQPGLRFIGWLSIELCGGNGGCVP